MQRMTTGKEEYSVSELLNNNKNCPLYKWYVMSNHINPKANTPGNAEYFNQMNEVHFLESHPILQKDFNLWKTQENKHSPFNAKQNWKQNSKICDLAN